MRLIKDIADITEESALSGQGINLPL